MRITFVFADYFMTEENKEIFKSKMDDCIKNMRTIFAEPDANVEWKNGFYKKGGESGWIHDHWVFDREKTPRIAIEKRGLTYIPEKVYLAYVKWYFNLWIMKGFIREII